MIDANGLEPGGDHGVADGAPILRRASRLRRVPEQPSENFTEFLASLLRYALTIDFVDYFLPA
jgi:hypothetical protein